MKNQFQIIGNIGSNILMNSGAKNSESDRPVTASKTHTILSIASNNNYKNKDGEWKKVTYWNDVNLFGEMAKRVYDKFSKGSLVLVEGTLSKVKFNDKDGVERYTTSLVAKSVKLLKSSDSSDDSNSFSSSNYSSQNSNYLTETSNEFVNSNQY